MFPQHYTPIAVAKAKASLGPFQFAGQYEQRPAPADDGFFRREWFKRFDPSELKIKMNFYLTSDHAPSGNGDYNVFRIWGVDAHRNLYLMDSFRKKCLMDEAMGIATDASGKTVLTEFGALPMIRKWQPIGWFPENDNTWLAISSMVKSAMLATETYVAINPLPTKGSGDKLGKAVAYQAMASMGLVNLPMGHVGDDAIAEYIAFGETCKHDDQVDADGAIARVISNALPAYIPTPEPKRRQRDFDGDDFYTQTDSDLCW